MNKAAWVLQALVALVFLMSGGTKLATPKAELRQDPRMAWTQDFSDGAISAIGAGEVAGAVGMIAPAATRIAPLLTPAAGVGLAALMGGAAFTHMGRGESPVAPLVLGALALVAAALRYRLLRGA